MKTLKFFSIALILSGTTILFSCSKKGCTDIDAKNYCDGCKKDDGTCTYEGSMTFWYNKTTSDSLAADGATSLTYYIDGSLIGSSAVGVYFNAAPNCGQSGAAFKDQDLGKQKSQAFTYSVKDQTGFEYFDGNGIFGADCLTLELVW